MLSKIPGLVSSGRMRVMRFMLLGPPPRPWPPVSGLELSPGFFFRRFLLIRSDPVKSTSKMSLDSSNVLSTSALVVLFGSTPNSSTVCRKHSLSANLNDSSKAFSDNARPSLNGFSKAGERSLAWFLVD